MSYQAWLMDDVPYDLLLASLDLDPDESEEDE